MQNLIAPAEVFAVLLYPFEVFLDHSIWSVWHMQEGDERLNHCNTYLKSLQKRSMKSLDIMAYNGLGKLDTQKVLGQTS